MKPTNLYYYILPFFLSINWLFPYVAKATKQFSGNILTSSTISKINRTSRPYPCAMQVPSASMVHKNMKHCVADTARLFSNKNPVVVNDSRRLKFAPLATVGMRYITDREPFLRPGADPINYRKPKKSRVDCSITGSSRWLASTQKYYLIFRTSALLSLAINAHSGLLCCIELGYNWYKKALLANMLSAGGIEFTPLLGCEGRYQRFLLQLQLGCEITDSNKPTVENFSKKRLSDIWNSQGIFSVNLQYMLREDFFVGITYRPKEKIPGLRLGLSL